MSGGRRPYGIQRGDQSERLAGYFLGELGLAVPVPREHDIGIDFYCALGRREGRNITYHSPFAVQVGTEGSKRFQYGGFNKKGIWNRASVDWLFSQEIPLFVCTIRREKPRFRLYQTGPMWLTRYQFGDLGAVELCPGEYHDARTESQSAQPIGKIERQDAFNYRIPLYNPIAELTLKDLKTPTRQAAIDAMEEAIKAEQRNITNRRLGVHVVTIFAGAPSNNASWLRRHRGGGTFWSSEPGRNIAQQIEELTSVATVLALNLHAQNATQAIEHLAPVFRLFPAGTVPPWIAEKLPPEVQKIVEASYRPTSLRP